MTVAAAAALSGLVSALFIHLSTIFSLVDSFPFHRLSKHIMSSIRCVKHDPPHPLFLSDNPSFPTPGHCHYLAFLSRPVTCRQTKEKPSIGHRMLQERTTVSCVVLKPTATTTRGRANESDGCNSAAVFQLYSVFYRLSIDIYIYQQRLVLLFSPLPTLRPHVSLSLYFSITLKTIDYTTLLYLITNERQKASTRREPIGIHYSYREAMTFHAHTTAAAATMMTHFGSGIDTT